MAIEITGKGNYTIDSLRVNAEQGERVPAGGYAKNEFGWTPFYPRRYEVSQLLDDLLKRTDHCGRAEIVAFLISCYPRGIADRADHILKSRNNSGRRIVYKEVS